MTKRLASYRVPSILLASTMIVFTIDTAASQILLSQAPQPVPMAPVPVPGSPAAPVSASPSPTVPRAIPNVTSVPGRAPIPVQPAGLGQTRTLPPTAPQAGERASQPAPPIAIQVPIAPERGNPFQSPTNQEQRNALQARIIQNAIEASIRQVEDRMRAEVDARIRELEAEAANRLRAQSAAAAAPGNNRGAPGSNQPTRPSFIEFRTSHALVRRTEVGSAVPDNWRLVGCINGRAIYNDGKVIFEHDDGESGSNCGRMRPGARGMQ